jgi:sulfur-oxidizing protein SoxZ
MNPVRLIVPDRPVTGQVITVRLLIQHPMETGYRMNVDGRRIPRNVIRLVRCEFAGQEVFRAEPSSGVSANPLFEFPLRVTRGGEWLVQWEDEAGGSGVWRQAMAVA